MLCVCYYTIKLSLVFLYSFSHDTPGIVECKQKLDHPVTVYQLCINQDLPPNAATIMDGF